MMVRASDRLSEGTFWNSPSLRTAAASSSPVGGRLGREDMLGAGAGAAGFAMVVERAKAKRRQSEC